MRLLILSIMLSGSVCFSQSDSSKTELFVVQKNEKFGLFDSLNGRWHLKPKWYGIDTYCPTFYIVHSAWHNDSCGVMSKSGEWIIQPQYAFIYWFCESNTLAVCPDTREKNSCRFYFIDEDRWGEDSFKELEDEVRVYGQTFYIVEYNHPRRGIEYGVMNSDGEYIVKSKGDGYFFISDDETKILYEEGDQKFRLTAEGELIKL